MPGWGNGRLSHFGSRRRGGGSGALLIIGSRVIVLQADQTVIQLGMVMRRQRDEFRAVRNQNR